MIEFLIDAAGEPKPNAVVVTVPASFQVAQRKATIKAASQAGLRLDNGDLFDEPVAAYVDYFAFPLNDRSEIEFGSGRLLVFDYGGGTCDMALFKLIITYHSAKGLTFDAVLTPRLVEKSFVNVSAPNLKRLIFVGQRSRAVSAR